MEGLFNVDILELIASDFYSYCLHELSLKTEKSFYNLLLYVLFIILLLGPHVWSIDFYNYMPLLFSNYFNKIHGSFSPDFPGGHLYSAVHMLPNFIIPHGNQ